MRFFGGNEGISDFTRRRGGAERELNAAEGKEVLAKNGGLDGESG